MWFSLPEICFHCDDATQNCLIPCTCGRVFCSRKCLEGDEHSCSEGARTERFLYSPYSLSFYPNYSRSKKISFKRAKCDIEGAIVHFDGKIELKGMSNYPVIGNVRVYGVAQWELPEYDTFYDFYELGKHGWEFRARKSESEVNTTLFSGEGCTFERDGWRIVKVKICKGYVKTPMFNFDQVLPFEREYVGKMKLEGEMMSLSFEPLSGLGSPDDIRIQVGNKMSTNLSDAECGYIANAKDKRCLLALGPAGKELMKPTSGITIIGGQCSNYHVFYKSNMEPKIVNVRKAKLGMSLSDWLKAPNHIYIGRSNYNVEGTHHSKWHNPFKLSDFDNPEECTRAYEKHIREKINYGEVDISELEGMVMGCWCKPAPCHGDVLIKIFREQT